MVWLLVSDKPVTYRKHYIKAVITLTLVIKLEVKHFYTTCLLASTKGVRSLRSVHFPLTSTKITFGEHRESNPGPLGEKCERKFCAMQPPIAWSKTWRSSQIINPTRLTSTTGSCCCWRLMTLTMLVSEGRWDGGPELRPLRDEDDPWPEFQHQVVKLNRWH